MAWYFVKHRDNFTFTPCTNELTEDQRTRRSLIMKECAAS